MQQTSAGRRVAVLLFLGGGMACAQTSGLPATAPTGGAGQTPVATAVNTVQVAGQGAKATQPQRAQVKYSEGRLEIVADNASLNQILREIGHQTGMKITGGVTDERVFGTYGPATPAKVLASLLEGTGSNMFLIGSATASPAELVLTPRLGGPTPPNPNAAVFDNVAQGRQRPTPPPQWEAPPVVQPPVAVNPQSRGTSIGALTADPMTPPAAPATAPDAQSTSTGSDQQSPNGVKTPQQIFQQLEQLQQQQAQRTPQQPAPQ